jgi:glycosyltransferase involved in cell wall biosynthesis
MAKILLISWSLPPEPTGSAVIVGNLAKQFTADEMVLAGEKPYRRPAVSWCDNWPRLAYIASALPPTWRGARWWRPLQIPVMLWRSVSLATKFQCSTLLAVFPNEEFLLVGYLTAVWTGVPLFAYFHNTYVENRRGLSLRFAHWLQARVFSRSQHVFVMSDGMVELYRTRYPHLQCSALVHSFNEEIPEFVSLPQAHTPLRLVVCGNINESCRDATVRFCEAVSRMDNVSLIVLSGTPRAELQALGLLRNGTRYETVSRDQVLRRLQEADIVVLPHGFIGKSAAEEYHTMFPTKTIEYLICGRPILAHTPPDCYLTRFLKKHNCALVVDTPSIPALIDAVEKLRADRELRSNLVQRALLAAEIFHAPRVATTLRAHLQRKSDDYSI